MQTPDFNRAGLTDEAIAELEARPTSIGRLLEDRIAADPDRVGWKYPDVSERWVDVTWREFGTWVRKVAAGLLELGVQHEERMAIVAGTRMEWIVADLANNHIGGATTTIYPNTKPEDVHYILENSESHVVVVENQAQLDKIHAVPGLEGQIRHLVILDGEADASDDRVITWAELERRGEARLAADPDALKERFDAVGPDTLATLIYTSGTTGRPKGVELTHDNWIFQAVSMATLHIATSEDVHYLWLPMSHVFGKDLVVIDIYHGLATAVDGRIDRIVSNLKVVRPTVMCGAPRIFEKVRAAVVTGAPRSGIKGRISRWAFSVGRDAYEYRLHDLPMPRTLAAKYAVADRLVFSKLRDTLGGRMRVLISGSAKLSAQVQQWFYSAGLTIQEGYGATETTAIAFFCWPTPPRFGTVGQVCPGLWTKLGEDGELMLKGPSITRGYHDLPEETAAAFDDEGYFRTGDIGVIDKDGFLTITDRKKDLMKTSGGKYVSPQEVESVLTANIPYVTSAIAVGEGRKYVSALLVLDHDLLMKWAQKRGIKGTYAELTQHPDVRASIQKRVDRANSHLERWETVKKFAILESELSVADGEMTPNMKVRRAQVIERYADVVDSLYDADVPEDAK